MSALFTKFYDKLQIKLKRFVFLDLSVLRFQQKPPPLTFFLLKDRLIVVSYLLYDLLHRTFCTNQGLFIGGGGGGGGGYF